MENLIENQKIGNRSFYFGTSGYLNDLIEKDGKQIAKICRVQQLEQATRGEFIWFNCRIADETEGRIIKELKTIVDQGVEVEIDFLGVYRGAEEFQCCLTEEDPHHILTLNVDLGKILSHSLKDKAT